MWEKANVSKKFCDGKHQFLFEKKDTPTIFLYENISVSLAYWKGGIDLKYETPQPPAIPKLVKNP